MGWIVIHDRNEALAPEVYFQNVFIHTFNLYVISLSNSVDKKGFAKFKSENHR